MCQTFSKRVLPHEKSFFSCILTAISTRPKSVTQIPVYAQQNDIGLKMTPFEGVLLCHNEILSDSFLLL